ncbi:D-2-hydroxyacid dehydrogenase [Brumimicrobium aurantiacum]|uniref:3-phosphoglycerate dehydrogenase n=1 Tax=Brumimicrobium aurantiacum TaxID=1737063 RepID=A0A3E1EZG4_9FLAO|nr:D-2-hydroxyacid dehydrogenase [Brumimicrobium aurantiacum]RFC54945.1 3-phosphoglycerate dehydrogenase [Brumimicrobium aurantiacum]
MKILANDGVSSEGIEKLEKAGFTVVTEHVKQDELIDTINKENYVGLLVRSATTVRKDLIDACPNLKFIGRGGVGMDNIDVEYAREKGLTVENTPAASSQSVAELAMASMFTLARSTYDSYKEMPKNGHSEFKSLKKKYSKGVELRGKTLLIIGFGRIGQALASYALGVGMKVIGVSLQEEDIEVPIQIEGVGEVVSTITTTTDLKAALPKADFITMNVPKPADGKSVITSEEFKIMKDGVRIINVARGGVIDEDDLLKALESGKVAAASLDVFEKEPTPRVDLLENEKIANTPHIGAATTEAQGRIGTELADKIIATFK